MQVTLVSGEPVVSTLCPMVMVGWTQFYDSLED